MFQVLTTKLNWDIFKKTKLFKRKGNESLVDSSKRLLFMALYYFNKTKLRTDGNGCNLTLSS